MNTNSKLLTIAALLGGIPVAQGSIIFSQYIDTDSGTTPKAVEIWNVSGSTIDFSTDNLSIVRYANTNNTSSSEFSLNSGTLADGEVIVIGDSDVTGVLDGNNGLTLGTNLFTDSWSFNGNDALEMSLGGSTTDLFGNIGGSSDFADAGVSAADQNIQLIDGITSGLTGGFADNEIDSRWETVTTNVSSASLNSLSGFGVAPVPEPSTYAALLGALALGFVVIRRRQRS